jgi:hypothetical protein
MVGVNVIAGALVTAPMLLSATPSEAFSRWICPSREQIQRMNWMMLPL